MEGDPLIDLRKHVERIVRPLVANEARKDRMRRELMAHLLDSYDAARAAGAGHEVALLSAIEALGDSATLRDELQASVPKWEASSHAADPLKFDAAFQQLIDPGNRSYAAPASRFSASMVKFLMTFCVAAAVGFCCVLGLSMDEVSAGRLMLGLAAGIATSAVIALWLGVSVFAVNYVAARLRILQCFHPSSAVPGIVKACVAYGLIAGYVVPFAIGSSSSRCSARRGRPSNCATLRHTRGTRRGLTCSGHWRF